MFHFLKKDKDNLPQDVKTIRDRLLRFIKEQLQKAEGGEGANIKGLQLFIACPDAEKHMYESAIYLDEEQRFKNEIQKIADDFAIDLPDTWTIEISFGTSLPAEAIKVPELPVALFVHTRKQSIKKSVTAYVRVLNGEAEKEEYVITSGSGKVCIGREKKVQTADGFFRINTIAFPAASQNDSNKYISRQHAHIEYDVETGNFLLYADEGGVPPRNKIKVRTAGEQPIKLQTTAVGYPLKEGDQIILGETALLEFSYSALNEAP